MARAGPRKIARYGDRFKATAVKLSNLPGVLIQDVAQALDIHPFMLSLWRKQVRDGVIVAKSDSRGSGLEISEQNDRVGPPQLLDPLR
jgi:transposase-like protein